MVNSASMAEGKENVINWKLMQKMHWMETKPEIYWQLNFLVRFISFFLHLSLGVFQSLCLSSMWKVGYTVVRRAWFSACPTEQRFFLHIDNKLNWALTTTSSSSSSMYSVILKRDAIINWEDYNEIIVFNSVWESSRSEYAWKRFIMFVWAMLPSEQRVWAVCVHRNSIKIMLFLLNAPINRAVSSLVSRLFQLRMRVHWNGEALLTLPLTVNAICIVGAG